MNNSLKLFIYLALKIIIVSTNYIGDVSYPENSDTTKHVVNNAYYLITTPKVWMSTSESVCIVILKEISLPNSMIEIEISSTNSRELFVQKYQALNSASQCIQIEISEIRSEKALLKLKLSDMIDETLELRIKPSNGVILIETSKPIYRTNERLQFRIITLNDWLRPIEEQFELISVENSKSMSVMHWSGINTTSGIISLDMTIAEDNVFGVWKIRVITKKNIVTEKIFKVLDYETPDIVISVDSPNYIYTNDRQSVHQICVRNGLGQLINGQINILASYFKFNWERTDLLQDVTVPYDYSQVQINGCYNLILESSKLQWNITKYSERNLKLNLQFIDSADGLVEEKSVEIPFVENKLIISFPSVKLMKQYFKPGLPYFGHVLVSRPDYSYATEQQINVCYQSREFPWIAINDYICQPFVSDSNGLIHYTIPPMSKKYKQIEVKVYSAEYPSIESRITLEPSFSGSDEYMTIKPLISRTHCSNAFVEFDIMFNRKLDKTNRKVYYQIIGRGPMQAPEEYILKKPRKWLNRQNVITDRNETFEVYVRKLKVKLPQQSNFNDNLINRILVYYLDSNNSLIADSNVFLTTCSPSDRQSTKISLSDVNDGNSVNVKLETLENSTCSVRVSQNLPHSPLKRINEFIEKFNGYQNIGIPDRCEQIYRQNVENRKNTIPYAAPYGLYEMNTKYETVINYGDAWDSFNDIGLTVSSNTNLDESPCEWDLYSRDFLLQLREGKNNQMKYFIQRKNPFIASQLQDLEKSLFNEILDWNVVNTDDRHVYKQIDHSLVKTSGQLYSDSVCVNRQFGVTYARNSITRKVNENNIRLTVKAPKSSRIGETVVYKVWVEKNSQQCLPVKLEVESSEIYEIVNQPNSICICGNTSNPISLMLRPKQIGLIDVKISVRDAIVLSGIDIGQECNDRQITGFRPQTVIKQLRVDPKGIVSKLVNNNVICNNDNNNSTEEYRDRVHNLSHMRDTHDMIVSNELLEPMVRYVKWKLSSGNHNALDSLSAFSASYYLFLYNNNMTYNWIHKNEIMNEMSKSYQSLLNYRDSDGSYSLIRSKRNTGDIGLTVSVFKVLAQSKPNLSYIENGIRINRLHHTLVWIYEQQYTDGCFYSASKPKHNVWPFSFENQYELTSYVLASLLESGLNIRTKPLSRALRCLTQNRDKIVNSMQTHPLSSILYTYIQVLNSNTDELQTMVQLLDPIVDTDEIKSMNSETLSYLGLIYYQTNNINVAKQIGQQLMKSRQPFQSPISCYAVTKLWPLLKNRISNIKVYRENNNGMVSTLQLNETHSHQSLSGHKIEISDTGCVLISNNQIKTSSSTNSTNFRVSIDGLDRGFENCNKRRVKLCIEQNVQYSSVQPVVRMQITTGFYVDNKLFRKMIDPEIVTKYKKLDREVLLFLHPINNNTDSYCITIPLVKKDEIYETSEAYIKIYDYYNEDIEDLIRYEIPLHCRIVQKVGITTESDRRIDDYVTQQ